MAVQIGLEQHTHVAGQIVGQEERLLPVKLAAVLADPVGRRRQNREAQRFVAYGAPPEDRIHLFAIAAPAMALRKTPAPWTMAGSGPRGRSAGSRSPATAQVCPGARNESEKLARRQAADWRPPVSSDQGWSDEWFERKSTTGNPARRRFPNRTPGAVPGTVRSGAHTRIVNNIDATPQVGGALFNGPVAAAGDPGHSRWSRYE